MTSAEFWLLDSVVEMRHPLSMLLTENAQSWFNRPHHGLNKTELVGLLGSLMDNGEMTGFIPGAGDRVLTRDELGAALDGNLEADYALTPKGGARWEATTNADWTHYFDESYGEEDELGHFRVRRNEYVGSITTARRELLEEYLLGTQYNGFVIDEPSKVFDVLQPWQATYWKELPEGHRARFLCVFAGRPAEPLIPDWFRAIRTWYKAPEI